MNTVPAKERRLSRRLSRRFSDHPERRFPAAEYLTAFVLTPPDRCARARTAAFFLVFHWKTTFLEEKTSAAREGFSKLGAAPVERKGPSVPGRVVEDADGVAAPVHVDRVARFEHEIVPLFRDRTGRLRGRGFNDE
jgi:hypothetical protein